MAKKSQAGQGSIAGWAKIRKRILARDNSCCRICGSDYQLNVHHKDWVREHNDDPNLVLLCSRCHHQVHLEGYKPQLYEDYPVPWGEDPQDDWIA